jgi:hypothetical protein
LAITDQQKWCTRGEGRARVVPEMEGCERNLKCGVKIVYLKGDFLHQGLSKCLPLKAQEQALHVVGMECNVIYLTDAIVSV